MVPTGSSSHDATAASNSPSPGQTASPTHPLDISFLLELPGDVVALGPDGRDKPRLLWSLCGMRCQMVGTETVLGFFLGHHRAT